LFNVTNHVETELAVNTEPIAPADRQIKIDDDNLLQSFMRRVNGWGYLRVAE
jgi:hypothetical protein